MAQCEMCGYDGILHRAIVEGTMLHICSRCIKYGEAIEMKKPSDSLVSQRLKSASRYPQSFIPPKPTQRQTSQVIVKDYFDRIKKARQNSGFTQDEVAKAIAERSSVIQRVEAGSLEPTIKLAKKLQQYLKVELIVVEERVSPDIIDTYGSSSVGFTIGDVIKRKK